MKEELIDRLFTEFDKDRNRIKANLLKVMDFITLMTEDEFGKLTLTIKYERNDTNGTKDS